MKVFKTEIVWGEELVKYIFIEVGLEPIKLKVSYMWKSHNND